MDGMELRGWSQQNPTIPSRDLKDPVGQALLAVFHRDFDALKNYAETMIQGLGGNDQARETVRQDW